MSRPVKSRLFAAGHRVLLLGAVAGLVAAQWKAAPLPPAALAFVLLLTLAKARLVILDFAGLRTGRPLHALPLMLFMLLAALASLTCGMESLAAHAGP